MELEQLRIFLRRRCLPAASHARPRSSLSATLTTSRAVTALERELACRAHALTRPHPLRSRALGAVLLTGAEALLRDADALADAVRAAAEPVGNGGKMNWSDCTNFFVNFLHFGEKPS